ncbi:hypothetical protein [Kineosporia babensis]|uniref:Uncharacterized protein n=1 Tax=Kineosporia babensis TaxID=499548 RepID=A0A9X1N8S7_9ACTN|nr:hypothetical protein [Kineosporia babensis]MCD5310507.1 hypothetical protein [Kineosporia babensis]
MQTVFGLVALGTAVWAGIDSSRLGARRGRLGGGFLDMGPAAWFFALFLFWIIGFPCYLVARTRLVEVQRQEQSAWFTNAAPPGVPPVQPWTSYVPPPQPTYNAPTSPEPQAWAPPHRTPPKIVYPPPR